MLILIPTFCQQYSVILYRNTNTHTRARLHTHTHTPTHTHLKALTLSNTGRKQNAVHMMYNIILMEELATDRRYVLVLTGRVRVWEGQEGKVGTIYLAGPRDRL